jgi:hypothetical protein
MWQTSVVVQAVNQTVTESGREFIFNFMLLLRDLKQILLSEEGSRSTGGKGRGPNVRLFDKHFRSCRITCSGFESNRRVLFSFLTTLWIPNYDLQPNFPPRHSDTAFETERNGRYIK